MNLHIADGHMTAGEVFFGQVDPAYLVDLMDRHRINQALLSPTDRWLAVENREGNDTLLAWSRRWSGRIQGYATANPWFGQRAVDELDRALDAGLSAIKLHPARQGFMLLDPVAEAILALAQRRHVLVYVVTGVPVASLPFQLAEVGRRFPEVNFIMGRSGRTDFALDLLPSLLQASNLYLETAYNPPNFIATVINEIGWERVIFASDSPFTNLELELGKLERLTLAPEALSAIMGGNLGRLLNLRDGQHACD